MYRRPDEWIVERWRTEPRLSGLQTLEIQDAAREETPPLWKDVALALLVVLALVGAAAGLFG